MTRAELIGHIADRYQTAADYPWQKYPDYAVFRHADRKWFAVLLPVSADKLGLAGKEILQVLNLKARPELVGSLRSMKGVLPAYHMNKEHWISVLLESGLSDELILGLVDDSHALTRK